MSSPPAWASGKLVLMVDDDESSLELMGHVVAKEGFRAEQAVDGREALAKAESLNPDLIILDLMLTGTSGYEVIRELQAQGLGHIPIIVVTGRAVDAKSENMLCLEPNVKDFLYKPLRPAILASSLYRCVGTPPIDAGEEAA